MLYSMTGFGKTEARVQNKLVSIELRSLNSKGFDVNIRMPQYLREKELAVRNLLSSELKRGKIDAFFNVELPDELSAHTINQAVAKTYVNDIQELAEQLGLNSNQILDTVLKLPNVLGVPNEELSDEEWSDIEKLVYEATDRLMNFREQEGAKTEKELLFCINTIREQLQEIPKFEQERIDSVRNRIAKHMEQFVNSAQIDENRLEQELIYYIEKYDLSEEKMRLSAHLDHFEELLDEDELAKGKKLNFISQEIGREINTIGSKANHADIQRHVVIMKDHLEQIKEQLANIL